MRVLSLVLLLVGCSKPQIPASDVCTKLVAAGVASNCKTEPPGGLGAAASEHVVFDLPSVPGKTGQVLRFDKASDYEATSKAFDAAAVLAGRHRYGSASALIYVQLHSGAPADVGAKAAAVVAGL